MKKNYLSPSVDVIEICNRCFVAMSMTASAGEGSVDRYYLRNIWE